MIHACRVRGSVFDALAVRQARIAPARLSGRNAASLIIVRCSGPPQPVRCHTRYIIASAPRMTVTLPPGSRTHSRRETREETTNAGASPESSSWVCVITSTSGPFTVISSIGAAGVPVNDPSGLSGQVKRPLPGVRGRILAAVSRITIEDVARLPRPRTTAPELLRFSPDGKTLTFLAPPAGRSGLARVLWCHDAATGEQQVLFAPSGQGVTDATVSLEEALRRERQRPQTPGVTSYPWARAVPRIPLPRPGAP